MSGSGGRIHRIMEFISAISAGDFDSRLERSGADDELDTLIEGLNGLAEELATKSGTLSTFERYATSLARANAELERRERRLAALAYHDSLTGLPNRQGFAEHAEDALNEAQVTGWNVAVLLLDLDGFKPVNDTHGHRAGDDVLREVARRLTRTIGGRGVACRLGGDEFAIIIPRARGVEHLGVVARELNAAIAEPILIDGGEVRVSVSVGGALSRRGRVDRERLLATADRAMYAAKQRGPGRFTLREPKRELRHAGRHAPQRPPATIRFPRSANDYSSVDTRRAGFVSPEVQHLAAEGRLSA